MCKKVYEEWKEYDENNKEIHYKNSIGYEWWKEYDEEGNLIHYKNNNGIEKTYEYYENQNEDGSLTDYETWKTLLNEWGETYREEDWTEGVKELVIEGFYSVVAIQFGLDGKYIGITSYE